MAAKIKVKLRDQSYDVLVGGGLLKKLPAHLKKLTPGRTVMLVSDSRTARIARKLTAPLRRAGFRVHAVSFPAGETSKNLDTVNRLYSACSCAGLDRKSSIVAVGGGVVGDVAGFLAATYLRGLCLVQVATTVVAQVDSSIGGKTGVDLREGKNLVGSFYQPRLVISDPDLLKTLPKREFVSGLAEVIKYGLIADAPLFSRLEKRMSRNGTVLDLETIARCVRTKAGVVSADEREISGTRAQLNFGHTIGHAIEAVAGYGRLLHGEAVSIGMVGAARLSARKLGFPGKDVGRIRNLLSAVGLPIRLPRSLRTRLARDRLVKTMRLDKKTRDGKLRFVLLSKIGRAKSGQVVTPAEVRQILQEL